MLLAIGATVWIASGAFIYYNTNVLNEHITQIDEDRWLADYEKVLYGYRRVPPPRITDVTLNVAIFPHDKRVETVGHYRVVNKTNKPMRQVHVRWPRLLKMVSLDVQGAHPAKRFDNFNYVIYAFDTPLMPGDARSVTFKTVWEQKGFRNRADITRIVDNGTFVNNREISPSLGMDRNLLLRDPVKRRRYGLEGELRPAKLEDDSARATSYVSGDADWVNSDITVSTVADQTPIAPGYQVSEAVRDGRRIVRFRSDAPVLYFFSMQSAAYARKHDKWHNVDLTVYYDPHHPYQVDRMLRASKASLEVFEKAFSPYQFRQVRILEFPAYERFAQSFANTIPYSEALGFVQDDAAIARDHDKIDFVTFVTAHEIGHQWWAHQVIGADMQGMTMLSETFAQYSAMLVMEHLYGPDHVRKFLKEELDNYLRSRGSEEVEELPLARVEDQGYVHYRKGAVIMYRLKEEVGQPVVDRSLRRLIAQYAFKGAPYPSSKDFLRILREEAGPGHEALIHDLFEKITLYDLKAKDATWVKRRDGHFDVTLTVDAHKYYADGKGVQTEVNLDEKIGIGLFAASPSAADFGKDKVLSLEPMRIHTGSQTIHVVTARPPAFAGIDPYNIWIDRNSDDNLVAATSGKAS